MNKEKLKERLDTAAAFAKETASTVKEKSGKVAENAKETAKKGVEAVKDTSVTAYKKAVEEIDANGNGEIDIEDIILNSIKIPGIRINREIFLRKELSNSCKKDDIDKAIENNPISAGIGKDIIDKLANDTIKFERNCVSGISAALGLPGGVAMVATIPADIAQYYGYMLRTAQKLLYLYGFPEILTADKDTNLDSATINTLTVCLGVMYGVAGANSALKAMARALSEGVSKQLMKKALTKGTVYPIVKSIAKWFNVKMTKEVFAGFFKKSIPVVGGVIGAGITYATFKPCCVRLKNALEDTALSNPNNVLGEDEIVITDYVEKKAEMNSLGNVFILGDSYSTFEGYIPEGYAVYYSPTADYTEVNAVEETWWYPLIEKTGSALIENNSWSGSTLCYTGYGGYQPFQSFVVRAKEKIADGLVLGKKLDTVLIFGGTNDSWNNSPVGELKYEGRTEEDLKAFLPALCELIEFIKKAAPEARIVNIVNCCLKEEITEGAVKACAHYGIDCVRLHDLELTDGHPTRLGMRQITEQIMEKL